jgi:hypothetical protein
MSEQADRICEDIELPPLSADMKGTSARVKLEAASQIICLKARLEERLFELYTLLRTEGQTEVD